MNKIARIASFVMLSLASTAAFSGEVEDYCELAAAQAATQSELLGSPSVFTNVGDPVTGANTLTIGVKKSLAGHLQAKTLTEIGKAQCELYAAQKVLKGQAEFLEVRANARAIEAAKPGLTRALAQARRNVAKERALLAAQTGTISNVKSASQSAESVADELSQFAEQEALAKPLPPASDGSLKEAISRVITAQAHMESLQGKLSSQSGWDVTVAAGARQDLDHSGTTQGFVALNATYSFGARASRAAANKIEALSRKVLSEQQGGPADVLAKTKEKALALLGAQSVQQSNLEERLHSQEQALARVAGVGTEDGLRWARAVRVDRQVTQAKLDGVKARIKYLKEWLSLNG